MKALKVAFTLWPQFNLQCNEAKTIASFIEVVYLYVVPLYVLSHCQSGNFFFFTAPIINFALYERPNKIEVFSLR